jgi:hypothetical protein
MKITNWCKKLSATLVAAGALSPVAGYAVNIPLGDPSFDNYIVPPAVGYAYAANPAGAYRPNGSPWVDDLDNPGANYVQDNHSSNWLYTAAYAENPAYSRRASPRTGNQAMHGLGRYSAQELTAVFEAGRTYRFSIWAQNDEILNEGNGMFLYIFDANVAFKDANALAGAGAITAINQRLPGMTAAQSQANWTPLSISHTVAAGAPEVGHAIGVGFFARKDTAVDDASLSSVVPEPTTALLVGVGGLAAAVAFRRRE